MKKSMLMAAICLVTGFGNACAQEVRYGIKGGLNKTTLVWNDNEAWLDIFPTFRTAGYAGVFANLGITENFSVQPELLYAMQGDGEPYSIPGISVEGDPKLNYLNLPVMAQLRVVERFYLEAGPQAGLLLHADIAPLSSEEQYDKEDIKDAFKNLDFALNVGLGYKFRFGLEANVRLSLGLSDINDTGDFNTKNRVLSAGIGYALPKEKLFGKSSAEAIQE